jgi:isoleucyl-tRNA synthetase
VAAEDYRDDVRLSEEILTRLAEGYRRIRNTCRYLLGNLFDFDPARDAVPTAQLLPIDRFILHRMQRLTQRVRAAYQDYEFHILYHSLHNFCAVDLSAFYLDVLKDRVYTSSRTSHLRRSAQTAMHEILGSLVKLMAPVLSFTADEVWRYIPMPAKPGSVHLAEEDLETICIVSGLTVSRVEGRPEEAGPVVKVERAPGRKCQRCWNYRESVGASAAHPALCDRCVGVLENQ